MRIAFDATSGSIMSMFDFSNGGKNPTLFLDQTQGTPVSSVPAI
jgi:phospholipase C